MPDMPSLAPPLRGVCARAAGRPLGALRAHHLTDGDRAELSSGDVDSRTAGTGRPMPRLHFAGRLQSFLFNAALHTRRGATPTGRSMRITSPTATGLGSARATSFRGRRARDNRCHASTSPGGCGVPSSRRPPSLVSGGPIGPALASRPRHLLYYRPRPAPGLRLLRRPHRGCAGFRPHPLLLCGGWPMVRAYGPLTQVENLPLCVTGSANSARPRASSRGCAMSNCCVDARLLSRGPAACRVPSGGGDEQSRRADLFRRPSRWSTHAGVFNVGDHHYNAGSPRYVEESGLLVDK